MKRKFSSSLAFTLVEMLVVIGIIVILAGLLFPTFGAVKEAARKTQAASDEQQIITASKSYYSDYGRYPMPQTLAAAGKDVTFGDPAGVNTNDKLFNILRNLASIHTDPTTDPNPRQVTYLEVKDARDKTTPTGGIVSDNATDKAKVGQWMDPWGTPYVVFIDGNYDNVIDFGGIYTSDTTANPIPRIGVGVASFGKDKKPGKVDSSNPNGNKIYPSPSDDVVSWR